MVFGIEREAISLRADEESGCMTGVEDEEQNELLTGTFCIAQLSLVSPSVLSCDVGSWQLT